MMQYINLLSGTINWLWKTSTTVKDKTVGQAAYEATKLRMLPAAAREGLKIPNKYCATPADAARRPEDVLPYVPSECWGKLLASAENITELTDEKKLMYNLTKEEGTNLPRGGYDLSQAMQKIGIEPVNYNHLPEQARHVQGAGGGHHHSRHHQEGDAKTFISAS